MNPRMVPQTEKTCRCGYGVSHHFVSVKHHYSFSGMFWLLFGASAKPRSLKWVCRQCHETLYETSKPSDVDRYHKL